jgi:hypothetical protein
MRTTRAARPGDLRPVSIKPQDVAVLLQLLLLDAPEASAGADEARETRTPPPLTHIAAGTLLSVSEVHYALRRLAEARLLRAGERQVNRHAMEEFLIHGVKYAFPPVRGGMARGIPTAYAAPPLCDLFMASDDGDIPVWPHASGTMRGSGFSPLYPAAPAAALADPKFYELLALIDAIRGDARARERAAAAEILRVRILGEVRIDCLAHPHSEPAGK